MSKSDEQIERTDKQRQRTLEAKTLPTTIGKRGGVADWAGAESNLVLQLVCKVGFLGGAVRYGYTRDGGAYSIGVYLGDDSKTYYCNEKDGVNEQLKDLIEYFER